MKFLANENYPKPSVDLLRQYGFDVVYILELYRGVSDEKVVEIACGENRIILTFDKDYGEIIFRYNKSKPPSVVFYRFKGLSPLAAGEILLQIINQNLW